MPTRLIKKHIEEFASWLRNQQDYDDFPYGTEPIPGDKTWCKNKKKCESCSCKLENKDEERLGVKEQQMYWMAIKALQEAQARIETL